MSTVAELAAEMFGVTPAPAVKRFTEPGWSYDETIDGACPRCSGPLHALGKPYASGGKEYRYAAFVCAECVLSFTLQELGHRTRKAMNGAPTKEGKPAIASTARGPTSERRPIDTTAGLSNIREWTPIDLATARAHLNHLLAAWDVAAAGHAEEIDAPLPGGGSIAVSNLEGSTGSMLLAIANHQRVAWGCVSTEVRLGVDKFHQGLLHIVTVECSVHEAAGEDVLPLAGEIAQAAEVRAFGVDPFRVGNTTASSVGGLVDMLRSPERNIPIVLLSGTARQAQAEGLIARTSGAALVATIDGDASWQLSERLGFSMGCYAGAVRIYPPFTQKTTGADCPVWVSRRVARYGWETVADEIVATVLTADQASRRPRIELELQREAAASALHRAAAEIERLKAEAQRERTAAPDTSSVDAEIDAIFDKQNQTIEKLETELDIAHERNRELESLLAESESTRQSLQLAFAHQQWSEENARGSAAIAIVDDSVEAAIERLADPEGALVCTESALRGWREARYPDPPRMLDALRRLEAAAIEWRSLDAEIGTRLGDWIQETTGLRFAGSDQGLERRDLDTFMYDGKKWSRIPHIKIDDRKHSNQVGRIYFAIDSPNRRWIVDHVGQKLYGR